MIEEKKPTSIQVYPSTRDRLKNRMSGTSRRGKTYDELINELLDESEKRSGVA